ncbi:MAG: methionine gamma-lyase family protein, partial [Clostridiales bacterium]|nr:methionine gamma-lyase family protein [Clostridiales bacterium]
MAKRAEEDLQEQFIHVDEVARANAEKVLSAFQDARVAENYFNGTTGYGYDDLGRDKLDEIYARIFHTEDALVRVQFINGTHAITCALFGALKPGDTLLYAVGAPYDTIQSAIGITGNAPGSLKFYGIKYRQVELTPDDRPDLDGIAQAVREDPSIKVVMIQRSRGYATRASLSVEEIGDICKAVRSVRKDVSILVDNCYGEFVETIEPTEVGADLVVGSLIKNPGGGLAPTGGYLAGRRDLIEAAAMRLTVPGIGKEGGCTLGNNRS